MDSKELITQRLGSIQVPLWDFMYGGSVIMSDKPIEVADTGDYFEITYYQGVKKKMFCTENPEIDEVLIFARDAPQWALRPYELREIDGCYVFIKNPLGDYFIPKHSVSEKLLSAMLRKESYMISRIEFEEKYD